MLFSELKRRNVFRVAIAYLAGSWLLVQVAETLFPVFGLSDAIFRLIVILLIIGFPVMLILSWLYELTPEGLKLESDLERSPSRAHEGNKQLDRAIIVVLTLALGYFAVDKFVFEPSRDAAREETVAKQARRQALESPFHKNSIAVLPFKNMSDDAKNEYFSDGISEELLNLLAEIPQLRVTSRTSAFSFRDVDVPIPDVAEKLNVAHVLEGSVRKSGNKVRITAQLIDARSDTHVWSESYDRTLEDVFEIQDEIAVAVVKKLKVTLLDDAPNARQTDTEAYTYYLQAKYLANQFTRESLTRAAELYEQALDVDAEYAKAWSGLGWVYANLANSGLRPDDNIVQLARDATWQALAIDLNNARAHANLGWIAMNYDDDLPLAARHYTRAMAMDPNGAGIINGAAVLTEVLGRSDEAVALYEHSIVRDPVNANGHSNLAAAYLSAGRFDEAVASIRTVLSLSPDRIGAHHMLGLALLNNGDAAAALDAFDLEGDEEYRLKGRTLALYELDHRGEFDASFTELRENWGGHWPSEIAQVYAWIGDADAAFEWLQKAADANETGLMDQALSPLYQKLHTDPRWTAFLEARGHAPDQLAAIEFEVVLPSYEAAPLF